MIPGQNRDARLTASVPTSTPSQVSAELESVVVRQLDRLVRAVERLEREQRELAQLVRRRSSPQAARDATWIAAIYRAFGDRPFQVRELLEFARHDDHDLRVVLDAEFELDARRAGKGLQRILGRSVAGLRVEQTPTKAGALWRVVRGDNDPSGRLSPRGLNRG